MANRSPPPIQNPLVDGSGAITLPWALFFNQTYGGDTGTEWTPEFIALSSTGTPTIVGRYYKLSSTLIYFRVTITPATDTSAVLGNTYIQNFPFQLVADAACAAVVPPVSVFGACVASSNRIYVPTWTNISVPVTITGFVEAR
jgi:hypothetical protein